MGLLERGGKKNAGTGNAFSEQVAGANEPIVSAEVRAGDEINTKLLTMRAKLLDLKEQILAKNKKERLKLEVEDYDKLIKRIDDFKPQMAPLLVKGDEKAREEFLAEYLGIGRVFGMQEQAAAAVLGEKVQEISTQVARNAALELNAYRQYILQMGSNTRPNGRLGELYDDVQELISTLEEKAPPATSFRFPHLLNKATLNKLKNPRNETTPITDTEAETLIRALVERNPNHPFLAYINGGKPEAQVSQILSLVKSPDTERKAVLDAITKKNGELATKLEDEIYKSLATENGMVAYRKGVTEEEIYRRLRSIETRPYSAVIDRELRETARTALAQDNALRTQAVTASTNIMGWNSLKISEQELKTLDLETGKNGLEKLWAKFDGRIKEELKAAFGSKYSDGIYDQVISAVRPEEYRISYVLEMCSVYEEIKYGAPKGLKMAGRMVENFKRYVDYRRKTALGSRGIGFPEAILTTGEVAGLAFGALGIVGLGLLANNDKVNKAIDESAHPIGYRVARDAVLVGTPFLFFEVSKRTGRIIKGINWEPKIGNVEIGKMAKVGAVAAIAATAFDAGVVAYDYGYKEGIRDAIKKIPTRTGRLDPKTRAENEAKLIQAGKQKHKFTEDTVVPSKGKRNKPASDTEEAKREAQLQATLGTIAMQKRVDAAKAIKKSISDNLGKLDLDIKQKAAVSRILEKIIDDEMVKPRPENVMVKIRSTLETLEIEEPKINVFMDKIRK